MRILIIGSEGNIGKPLTEFLATKNEVKTADIKQGYKPDYYVADINFGVDLLKAFEDCKPEIVILLSAMVSRVTCEQAPTLAVATNLLGVQNVLELCKMFNSKILFFSTSEVYGNIDYAMKESEVYLNPTNRYGLTKLLGERLVNYEIRYYGLKATIIRPFMIYGENEDLGDHRSAIIRFAYNLSHGKPIEIHVSTSRSWLHISDAVRVIDAIIDQDFCGIINIGSRDVCRISKMANMICRILDINYELSPLINLIKQPDQMTSIKIPDLSIQYEMLKVIPQISLDEGLRRVVERVKDLP